MTTAREQAREAVVAACQNEKTGDYELADAASDVWEPILRDLLVAGDHMARFSDHEESVREWDGVARRTKGMLQ